MERECGISERLLTEDVLRDVLERLDGVTLARASCVSSQFRSAGCEEAFWEKLCNKRWPSTMLEPVKALVATTGGFRKLYSDCCPLISCDGGGGGAEDDEVEAADFISIVDVTYGGEAVLSRVVEGVPGAIAMCGPLVDVLEIFKDNRLITIYTNLPRVASVAQERKDGRFWSALCSHLRLSWILVNKRTKRAVNLGSWKPLGGIRHRPCGDDFLLRFGSILPTRVHCNIIMRCTTSSSAAATTIVRVTELGMHLEDVHGVHLRGSQALSLLSRAMNCDKNLAEGKVLFSYKSFMASQLSNQEKLVRMENHLQIAGAVFFLTVFVIAMSFIL